LAKTIAEKSKKTTHPSRPLLKFNWAVGRPIHDKVRKLRKKGQVGKNLKSGQKHVVLKKERREKGAVN